jgi:hypothetical protein
MFVFGSMLCIDPKVVTSTIDEEEHNVMTRALTPTGPLIPNFRSS